MLGQAGERAGPGAGGDDDAVGRDARAVGELDALDALLPCDRDARDGRALPHHAARSFERGGKRRHERARIDGMVVGDREREPEGGRERRLAAAGLARQQPLDGKPERLALGQLAVERLGVVAVARDEQGAAGR